MMGVVFDKVTGLGKGGGTRGIFLSNYTDSRRTIETRIRGSLDLSACLRTAGRLGGVGEMERS